MGEAPRVACGARLVEEAHRGELRIGREPLLDQRVVAVEFGAPHGVAHRRGVEVAIELAAGQPVIDRAATEAEALSDRRLGEALLDVVSE
jgi:hypothetical protein